MSGRAMGWLIGIVVAVIAVTVLGAWIVETRMSGGSRMGNTLLAAASFPALAFVLFVIMTAVTLLQGPPNGETGTQGMVVFSFVFFLFYACIAGVVIGLPTAFVAVRAFRGG